MLVLFGAGLLVVKSIVPPIKLPYKLEDGPFIISTFPSDPKSISSKTVEPVASVIGILLRKTW